MMLRLTDEQTETLRARAEREGRTMEEVARAALDEYLARAGDDAAYELVVSVAAGRIDDVGKIATVLGTFAGSR